MPILNKERVPAFSVEDKYVDALIAKPSNNFCVELSLLLLISRFGEIDVERLINMVGFERVQIEVALYRLEEIGFLKKCEFIISN